MISLNSVPKATKETLEKLNKLGGQWVLEVKEDNNTECDINTLILNYRIMDNDKKIIELTRRHMIQMKEKNILISIYTNASGFLWGLMKVSDGTNLGWSDFDGDCDMSGTYTSYEKALESALDLVSLSSLEDYEKFRSHSSRPCHWSKFIFWVKNNFSLDN